MTPTNADGSGQAPTQSAAPAANGQAPTPALANNDPALSGTQNGQAPAATTQSSTLPTEHEWKRFQQELAEARRDAAKLTAERKALTDAQLTTEQKRERDFADMQTQHIEAMTENQRLKAQITGYRLANTLGISDIGAALALVYSEHEHELEFDETTREPKNLEKLLKLVLTAHPVLAAQAGQQPAVRPAANSGGATNPGAQARNSAITRASWQAMSPQERILRNNEMKAILQANGGRLPD